MAVSSGYGKHFIDVSEPEFDQTMKVRKDIQTISLKNILKFIVITVSICRVAPLPHQSYTIENVPCGVH